MSFKSALAISLLAVAASTPAALARDSGLQGGPGGSLQRWACPAGSYLYGAYVRYGDWLDYAAPLCVKMDSDGTWGEVVYGAMRDLQAIEDPILGPRFAGPGPAGLGSDGGSEARELKCPANQYVTGLGVVNANYEHYVARIALKCASWNGKRTATVAMSRPAPNGVSYVATGGLKCKPGHVATGLYGRAGIYVDAIGLSCDRQPGAPIVISQGQVNDTQQAGKIQKSPEVSQDEVNSTKQAGKLKLPPPIIDQGEINSTRKPGKIDVIPASTSPAAPVTFKKPKGPTGLPLYACASLDEHYCGEMPAKAFCKSQGYATAISWDMKRKHVQAESTIGGFICEEENENGSACRVFKEISCGM